MTQQVDGREAYRDDPEYTAPEMQPGNGEDATREPNPEFGVVAGTGMTIGAGGGAIAGQALLEEVEEERAETTLHRDGEV